MAEGMTYTHCVKTLTITTRAAKDVAATRDRFLASTRARSFKRVHRTWPATLLPCPPHNQ